MAKKQTLKSLLGSNDKREQVELNLNPVNLQPTIGREGGNYRVAVQQTPKTNSALQLSEALKGGVKLYSQAVEVAQNKAKQDVSTMTEEEYDVFLEDGLDPEAKNLFGYTKAYNRALAQKYYAEEIPNKLQDVSLSMFENYYDYKDADAFEAALNEKTQAVYDEADELLNDNVFGNEANRVLKNATRNDFVTKERAKFIQELPRRNAELATESINRGIEAIDDSVLSQGMFGETTRNIYNANAGNFRTPKDANKAFYTSVYTRIQTLVESKSTADNDLAQQMLDQIGDGKSIEGIDRTVGGKDIFATGDRQLALTKLDAALDQKADTAYEDAVEAVQIPVTEFQANTVRALALGTPETEVRATLTQALADLESPEGIANNPNDIERDLIAISLKSMLDNPKYFRNEHVKNYWQNNQTVYQSTLKTAIDNIPNEFTEATSAMANATRKPVGRGAEFVTAAEFELSDIYTDIAIEVSSIEDSTERLLKFRELEKEGINQFNVWKDEWFGQASIAEEQEEASTIKALYDEALTYDEEAANENKENKQSLKAIIADGKADNRKEALDSNSNLRGVFFKTRFDNFIKAHKEKMFSEEDLARNFNDIHGDFHTRHKGIEEATKIAMFGKTELERVDRAEKLASKYQVAGIDSENLISGMLPYRRMQADISGHGGTFIPFLTVGQKKMSFEEFFAKSGLTFDEFPVVVDGDIQNTINAVDSYFNAKGIDQLDEAFSGPFKAIADKYGISIDSLMQQQRSYLQKYNYIKSE